MPVVSEAAYLIELRLCPWLVDVGLTFEKAEMQMDVWQKTKTNEELRRLVGVEPITTVI